MTENEVLPPTIFVIFGITGDLSRRYLLPALAQIVKAGHVEDDFIILGVSRRQVDVESVIADDVKVLRPKTQLFQMDVDNPEDYKQLDTKISELRKDFGKQAQVIYYLVVPPAGVLPIIKNLGEAGLNKNHAKLLLEKPFGSDLESARQLITQTSKYFSEDQVYRIDHYLAKEMAQNITVFLGSNAMFRNIWNNRFIEKIEIDVLESIGIEGRGDFYEPTGALRDIVQSHGLQLAALVLMEPCSDIFDFEEIPRRRLAALSNLQPVRFDSSTAGVVRGQYADYKEEAGAPGSVTETFVHLKISSKDPRWEGVPITLTTGKKLNERLTEIRVHFKAAKNEKPNLLRLRVQPHEGIELGLWVKSPGYLRRLQKVPLEFSYQQHFDRLPNAYEQVLVDAMLGNQSLFASGGEILASWKILDPVIKQWQKDTSDLKIYKNGSSSKQVLDARV
ncbi:MAG: zwf, glucose-6-phosphate 1-dehydrogenase [Candidatus Saccharibacteria bacterium]|nr:zwf, glucose-6-phosphate 1-dehydrogenase [Candidatus Saccharibacteria bacterium]